MSADGGKLRLQRGKRLRFACAARGIRLGVEKEDQFSAGEIGERRLAAGIARKPEVGSRAALGRFCRHAPSFRRFPSVSVPIRKAGLSRWRNRHVRATFEVPHRRLRTIRAKI